MSYASRGETERGRQKADTMARDEAYKLAEQKIEEALKSGATELNLSNMNLTELPDSLGNSPS